MSKLKMRTLLLVLTCLAACGTQVVEFKLDAGAGRDMDGGVDTGSPEAAPPDAAPDLDAAQPDAAQDAEAGTIPDADMGSPPVVLSTLPVNTAMAVPPDDSVFATFSKAMDVDTLNSVSFTLMEGTTALAGVVAWDAQTNTAVFNPTAPLTGNALHTATITTGARDTEGRPLTASYTWTFTTAVDPSPPRIAFTVPVDDAIDVAAASTRPSVTFSGDMDPATINDTTFTLSQGGTLVAGVVSYDAASNTATFSPSAALGNNLVYEASVSTGAMSTRGLALGAVYTWHFTTSPAPTVTSTMAAGGATSVPPNDSLFATFSKPMDGATLNGLTFSVMQGATTVPGTVTWNALTDTATFNPTAALASNTLYSVTITTGAKDTDGIPLASNYTWSFTTAAAAVAPRVAFTTPVDDATNVAVTVRPTATFSGAMDPTTISAATFVVSQGATPVQGVVTYNAATNTATFSPSSVLGPNLVYTVTVTTGAKDATGLALAADYRWDFTTAVRPTVLSTVPATGAVGVPPNNSVFAVFSKTMDPTSVTNLTFTLKQGATAVAGVVSLDGQTNTATFNPTAALGANLTYTATITTGVRDSAGLAMATNYTWMFTTAAAPAAPTVVLTSPANAALDVAVTANMTATFSGSMDATTINTTSFTVKRGATSVPGVVTYNAATNTATFNPTGPLSPSTLHTATITTAARNTAGTPLTSNVEWTFTTSAAPTVTSTVPVNGALAVPVDDSITATFSRAMEATTISSLTFTVVRGTTSVAGLVTYNAVTRTATFNPTGPLTQGALHTAKITTGARDTTGQALAADYVWSFTTVAAPAPTVLSTTPLNNAMSAPLTTRPTATFNGPMDATTITDQTFTLKQGLLPVLGTVGYDSLTNTATFTPAEPLGLDLSYTATITTGARNTGGSALASDYTWTFETDACGQLPITLGDAGDFLVLAGSTVTSTGPTSITGNLGVSPGTAVTGFPPGIVTGMTHAGTVTSALAIDDLTTAYNEAAGRVLCPVSVAGNLGGMTLAPGLYKSTSSLAVSSGDLTLDAQGDAAAVFIFQMASTLTTTGGRKVLLINGADAANVFWQVGTSATLGTTSVFHGTIMADQSVTLETGATLNGRALARIAAVGLDSNTIVAP